MDKYYRNRDIDERDFYYHNNNKSFKDIIEEMIEFPIDFLYEKLMSIINLDHVESDKRIEETILLLDVLEDFYYVIKFKILDNYMTHGEYKDFFRFYIEKEIDNQIRATFNIRDFFLTPCDECKYNENIMIMHIYYLCNKHKDHIEMLKPIMDKV